MVVKINVAKSQPQVLKVYGTESDEIELTAIQRLNFLNGIELFGSSAGKGIGDIEKLMSERIYQDGEYLCRQGEKTFDVYFVYSGRVNVVRESAEGERIVRVAGPGEYLGEISALTKVPRTASFVADGKTRALIMNGEDFSDLLRCRPEILSEVTEKMTLRLSSL
ncbi:MAG TPA: cyclic nucleotide-binding domain-containing protein [bacterium]|nr:cyclic nucleotide-binding domain-containing protein [bacterium]